MARDKKVFCFIFVMSKDNRRIRLYVVGGLGEAPLTRAYLALYTTDLKDSFEIAAIADIYERDEVRNKEGLRNIFDYIKKNRLKNHFIHPLVEENLTKRLVSGDIEYSQLDKKEPELPDKFKLVGHNDLIDNSTPNKLHTWINKQIWRENKNAIVQKPFTYSLEEIADFRNFLRETGNTNGTIKADWEHYSHYGNVWAYMHSIKDYVKDYGKIKEIELYILEHEDFSSMRNQEIIELEKSGGGMWLDTGIHTIAFPRNINAEIDCDSIDARAYKANDPFILDEKYGETSMGVNFNVSGEYFDNCRIKIKVGKCSDKTIKIFKIHHERGRVELDILNKNFEVFDNCNRPVNKKLPLYSREDAFYNVLKYIGGCIRFEEQPFTSIDKALGNVEDVCHVYERVNVKPYIQLPGQWVDMFELPPF